MEDNNDKSNLFTTIYYAYWWTTKPTNPTLLRPHVVFTDWRQQRQIQP